MWLICEKNKKFFQTFFFFETCGMCVRLPIPNITHIYANFLPVYYLLTYMMNLCMLYESMSEQWMHMHCTHLNSHAGEVQGRNLHIIKYPH